MNHVAQEVEILKQASANRLSSVAAYIEHWIDKKCEQMGIKSRWDVQFEQEYEAVFVKEEEYLEPFEPEEFEEFSAYYNQDD